MTLEIEDLKIFLHQKNPEGALSFISDLEANINRLELSNADMDMLISNMFDEINGTIPFLTSTISQKKLFQEANVKILNIWTQICRHCGNENKLLPHISSIIDVCIKFIHQGDNVSAKEKEKAAQVLQEIFRKKLVFHDLYFDITGDILKVFNLKKRAATFSFQIFRLLGIMAENYKNLVALYADSIRNIFMKTVEDTILNDEAVQNIALSGAVEGLNNLLKSFPLSDDESLWKQRIYTCIRKLCNYDSNQSHKASFRASLGFFDEHYDIFLENIYIDFDFWSVALDTWKSSSIIEDAKRGVQSTHIFHKAIAKVVFSRLHENRAHDIVRSLIHYFVKVLENPISKSADIRIVIKGFGCFSNSSQQLFPELYSKLLTLVIQKTELLSITEDKELKEHFEHFPDYIQALSLVILYAKEQSFIQILGRNIQMIMIRFFKDFHYLPTKVTSMAVDSLCFSFHNLMICDVSLADEIIQEVILQSIIWTCSHKPVFEATDNWSYEEDWKENLTYRNYLPLWFALLDENSTHSCIYDKSVVSGKFFYGIISSLFIILEKLNLQTKKRLFHKENGENEEFNFCDPNIDLCPVKPRDFHIFFNIVDFYRDVLRCDYKKDHFNRWLEKYCLLIIKYYNKNPLISGFLKLLECAFGIEDFYNCCEESLKLELSYFLKNILQKFQNFHGEIKRSCIELILKYPVEFYEYNLNDLVDLFKAAFYLGKSDSWIAKLSTDTLISLYTFYEDSSVDLKYFCKKVFPLLNSFLESQLDDNNVIKKRLKKERIKQLVDSDKFIVQKKILNFLGNLDQDTAALIISKPYKTLTKWNSKPFVELNLRFSDVEPTIYLDSLLPKMCQLSMLSANRQTKLSCCEFIHSYTVYVIGRRHLSDIQWKEICRTVLILGSDNDITIQEMFKPLLSQIMHYLSKRENINSDSVEVLLNCLMDGISNASNNSIRDLSAICLMEFVEWSLKHSTSEQLNSSSASITEN